MVARIGVACLASASDILYLLERLFSIGIPGVREDGVATSHGTGIGEETQLGAIRGQQPHLRCWSNMWSVGCIAAQRQAGYKLE